MELVELSNQEINELLEEFYSYFENGYKFEEFLKIYLEKIGLDEIEVTQKSRDGGIDLKAIKNGIDELSDLDVVKYYIQAKRYKPSSSVPIANVRELRGVMPTGYKGVLITTGKFSKDAYEFSKDSSDRPIILIDGKTLVESCIDKGLGFKVKPVFSKENLDYLMKKEGKKEVSLNTIEDSEEYIRKIVSKNDIRSRILSIPTSIYEKLDLTKEKHFIEFNPNEVLSLKLNKDRKYFGGITEMYKKYGLIDEGNIFISKMSLWTIYGDRIKVKFE